MKRIFSLTLLLAFVFATGTTLTAHAQDTQGLVITPPTFELSANPGSTIENSIRVDNLNDTPLELSVDRRNFTALGDEGQVGLTTEESAFSLASWIKIDPETITLPAKSSKTFHFSITVPANAEPGGRFGSIVFKTTPKELTGQSGLSVGQELGSLLLLRVSGQVTEKARIESFSAKQSFAEYGPIDFSTVVKNEGNVHIKPSGTITITDTFGRKVATVPIESKNALPGAMRRLEASLPEKSLFGHYTATLSLQYGANQQTITASTTFTVIPYKVLGFWLAGILIIGGLIYWRRDRILKAIRILSGKE